MHIISLAPWRVANLLSCLVAGLPLAGHAGSLVRSGTGANPAGIQVVVDQFRADLGGVNNGVGEVYASGRREINWDGVPDTLAAPNNLNANFFNTNSPRGVVLSTPGTGFQVSADSSNPAMTPTEFGNIDPSYPNAFAAFSPQRLFTAGGSTITDVAFFVPGTTTKATVSGFGAVFTDVDSANVTSIQFFGIDGVSLGTFFAPNVPAGSETLSFLGVSFTAGERVARVRITCGNQVLAPGNNATDGVVMDDFIYGEPQAIPTVTNVNTGEVFLTIQTAIADADTSGGHVLEAQPGTYSELVTVNKSLTIRGAKHGLSGVDFSRGTGESIINGTPAAAGRTTAFNITVSSVTIDGFTVQDVTHPSQFGTGIRLAPSISGTTIRNNIIKNNIVGLFLSNNSPTSQAVVEQNLFRENLDNAIYSDSTISGGSLVNAVINANSFQFNLAGSGVALLSTVPGSQSRIVIANNQFTRNGNGVRALELADSMITRNAVKESGSWQISLGGGVVGMTVTENYIEGGAEFGIRVGNSDSGAPNQNIAVNCNSIAGNDKPGLAVDSGSYTGSLDATGNWWGSASGPTIASNPGGSGQQIVDPDGKVNFSQFLASRNDQQRTLENPGFQCTPAAVFYGVDASNRLVRFASSNPGTVLSGPTISGMQAGEEVLGIDFRPSTGELFAVGNSNRLYVIDPETAVATFRATLSVALVGAVAGIDFDPVQDLFDLPSLRIVTSTDQNVRVNVSDGAVTSDTSINPAGFELHALAFTNVDRVAGTGTSLYGYDFAGDVFVIASNVVGGTYAAIGRSGVVAPPGVSLDIQTARGRNVAFFSIKRPGNTSLYIVNLVNGLMTPVGGLPDNFISTRGLAVAPASFEFSEEGYTVTEKAGAATITIERLGSSDGEVSVRFRTFDGGGAENAKAPDDYMAVDQVVTFASGVSTRTVSVPIINDSLDEDVEALSLLLSNGTGGAATGNNPSAILFISGIDEITPTLSTSTSGSTTPGGMLSGTATLASGDQASGTVTFSLYGPDDASCGGAPIFTSTVSVNGNGTYSSEPFTPTRTGNYVFVASYSGDANNVAVTGACGDPGGSVTVKPATVLANIATRLRVETGDNVLIGGIIVSGTLPKRMMVRAIGPSSGVAGALGDPYLELYSGPDLVAENNNWRDAPNQQEIFDTTIAPSDDRESAILVTLNPGAYTAVMSGVNGEIGVGVVEAYDLDRTVDSKFANIATRGRVQSGDNVMIGGLIILGDTTQNVLVRAIGPSLPVGGKLADPTLELVDANGDTFASNNNWRDTQQAEIEATGIPPSEDLESAILATLAPAPYTAIVRGSGDSTGVALVEVYALQ